MCRLSDRVATNVFKRAIYLCLPTLKSESTSCWKANHTNILLVDIRCPTFFFFFLVPGHGAGGASALARLRAPKNQVSVADSGAPQWIYVDGKLPGGIFSRERRVGSANIVQLEGVCT